MPRPKPPACLYHWSPTSRRKQIERYGLRPRMIPVTHFPVGGPYEGWRAGWVCLAEDPHTAWRLSAGHHKAEGTATGALAIRSWDLWQVHLSADHRIRLLKMPTHREWRVYDRIYKRGVIYLATDCDTL